MTIDKALLTAEDLFRLPDPPDGGRYELLDGEIVTMSPTGGKHGWTVMTFGHRLLEYLHGRDLGEVMAGDVGIVLRRNPDRVRAPDICFFARERIPVGGIPPGYFEIVPDLVVEVVSPNDTRRKVDAKAREWARAGVRLVLTLDPGTRTVTAYRGEGDVRVYAASAVLDLAPVLPEFRVAVADLFA